MLLRGGLCRRGRAKSSFPVVGATKKNENPTTANRAAGALCRTGQGREKKVGKRVEGRRTGTDGHTHTDRHGGGRREGRKGQTDNTQYSHLSILPLLLCSLSFPFFFLPSVAALFSSLLKGVPPLTGTAIISTLLTRSLATAVLDMTATTMPRATTDRTLRLRPRLTIQGKVDVAVCGLGGYSLGVWGWVCWVWAVVRRARIDKGPRAWNKSGVGGAQGGGFAPFPSLVSSSSRPRRAELVGLCWQERIASDI